MKGSLSNPYINKNKKTGLMVKEMEHRIRVAFRVNELDLKRSEESREKHKIELIEKIKSNKKINCIYWQQ